MLKRKCICRDLVGIQKGETPRSREILRPGDVQVILFCLSFKLGTNVPLFSKKTILNERDGGYISLYFKDD